MSLNVNLVSTLCYTAIRVSDSRGSTKVKSLRQQLDLLSSSHLIFFKFQQLVRL